MILVRRGVLLLMILISLPSKRGITKQLNIEAVWINFKHSQMTFYIINGMIISNPIALIQKVINSGDICGATRAPLIKV